MRHTFRVAWFFVQDLSLFFNYEEKRGVEKTIQSFVYKSAREAANALCLLERAQLLSSRPPARHPSFCAPSFWVSVASPLERDRGGGGETRRNVFGCRVVKIKRLESREKSFVGSRRRKQWHHHRRAAIEAIERSRRRRRTRHRRRARTRGRTTDAPRKGTKREDWCLVSSPLRGRELTMDDTSFYFSLTGASRRAVAANKRTTTTTTTTTRFPPRSRDFCTDALAFSSQ